MATDDNIRNNSCDERRKYDYEKQSPIPSTPETAVMTLL